MVEVLRTRRTSLEILPRRSRSPSHPISADEDDDADDDADEDADADDDDADADDDDGHAARLPSSTSKK